jgi:hypothetical protein
MGSVTGHLEVIDGQASLDPGPSVFSLPIGSPYTLCAHRERRIAALGPRITSLRGGSG